MLFRSFGEEEGTRKRESPLTNKTLCLHPSSVSFMNILYANGTCWSFPAGSTPTLCTIPASARAVYAPREKPKMQIRSPFLSMIVALEEVGVVGREGGWW